VAFAWVLKDEPHQAVKRALRLTVLRRGREHQAESATDGLFNLGAVNAEVGRALKVRAETGD